MPSTANKGLETPVTGSLAGTWGDVLNAQVMGYLDTFLGGITSLSLLASNVLLTQSQCRNVMLRMTGALAASVVVGPDVGVLLTGFVYWENLTTNSQTVTFTNTGGSVVLPQSRRGILWADTTNGPRIMAIVGSGSADPIPVGTVMLFYQSVAPVGWTIVSSVNDYGLKIVTSGGGNTSGIVAYSTLFERTTTDSHTLTTNEIPSHTHSYLSFGGAGTQLGTSGGGSFFSSTTGATGGGAGHTHDIDMRVQTAAVILATKN